MKICPVCNDSFADQLNFCDIDGARLAREGSAQERNKWWSLLGAGLLVGALVISAASIFFLPKGRVAAPIVNSETPPAVAPSKPASAESAASVAANPPATAEAESLSAEAVVPEVKKKDRAPITDNGTSAVPNPKAAFAVEDSDKKSTPVESKDVAPAASKKTEPSPSGAGETRSADAIKLQPPPDLKDTKSPSAIAKGSDKESGDKKKTDDKKKKKGGFLRVFKKIFGKD